jgi:predicted PurR-regulated permease PerM
MTRQQWWQQVSATVVALIITGLLAYVVSRTLTVLTLFGVGLLIAYVLDPILDRLQAKGWSRAAAAWTVMLAVLIVIAVAGVIIVPQLVAQAQDVATHWRDYSDQAQATYVSWRGYLEGYVHEHYPNVAVMPFVDAKVEEASAWLQDHLPAFFQWASQRLISSLGMVGMGAFLIIITLHFSLIIDPFRKNLRALLPEEAEGEVDRVSTAINRMLGQYLRGVVLASTLVGILATLVLTVLGMVFGTKYGLVLGIVTGVTYMVPYVGPAISALGAAFFGYVTCQAGTPWVSSLVAMGCMIGVNQLFDAILTPILVGRKVGLHPLVLMLAAFMGFSLLGVPGMIIATPVAASIKIILARWLPTQAPEPGAEGPRSLDLDLHATFRMLGQGLRTVTHVRKYNHDEQAKPEPAEAAKDETPG